MQKKTILVVDDSSFNIAYLKIIIGDAYNLEYAVDGTTALEYMMKQGRPDLVLLDVVLPDIEGYEVCRVFKNCSHAADTPVIFVTSNSSPEEITRGFECGGVDYVTKPYNPKELLARVETHIKLKDSLEKMKVLANKLGKYLPAEVYNSIFTGDQDVRIETAKKFLSVCFTDIVDFIPQSENMSNDELTSWLNNYMNKMAEVATRYGGTLDKFIGDAVMVFFGDLNSEGPTRDALACVLMAKSMLAEADKMGIRLRIGINSGECVVGNFGSESRMDYTIIGKEVNAAQRLEASAETGKILLSESTWNLVKDRINCRHYGDISVKGISKKINTYWLE